MQLGGKHFAGAIILVAVTAIFREKLAKQLRARGWLRFRQDKRTQAVR